MEIVLGDESFYGLRKIMAEIQAIHNRAKLYHWKSAMDSFFGDHLLFDRIADTFNAGMIDDMAEQVFMAHDKVAILDTLTEETAACEARMLTDLKSNTEMCVVLRTAINRLLVDANYFDTGAFDEERTLNAMMDEISQKCSACNGLLARRIDAGDNKLFVSVYEEPAFGESVKEGISESIINSALGLNSKEVSENYKENAKEFATDLAKQMNKETAIRLLKSCRKESHNGALYESAMKVLSKKVIKKEAKEEEPDVVPYYEFQVYQDLMIWLTKNHLYDAQLLKGKQGNSSYVLVFNENDPAIIGPDGLSDTIRKDFFDNYENVQIDDVSSTQVKFHIVKR